MYNEINPYAAKWLQNLVDEGLIAPGRVDTRSITELEPEDCPDSAHFFAGIGGWSYALRLAGVPDDAPVWTGSCPCQPFSQTGRQRGFDDERHLWPVWAELIKVKRPPIIFGEQVASPSGRAWMSVVRADLENMGYEVGAADLCAAGVGAPHVRQRLYWGARLADADGSRIQRLGQHEPWGRGEVTDRFRPEGGDAGRLDNPDSQRLHGERVQLRTGQARECTPENHRPGQGDVLCEEPFDGIRAFRRLGEGVDWLLCADPTTLPAWRPVRPGSFPMAYGVPERVGKLRALGNAIVPQLAAEFIAAFLECD